MVFYNIQSIIFIFNQNHTKHGFSRKRYINSVLISYVSILPVAFWHYAVLHFDIVSLPLPNWVAVGSWTAPGPWQKNHESAKGNRDDRGGNHHRSQPPLKNHSTKIMLWGLAAKGDKNSRLPTFLLQAAERAGPHGPQTKAGPSSTRE